MKRRAGGSMLADNAAKDMGRVLRFVRSARELTLREVGAIGGVSAQYVQNLERGQRTSASEEAYAALAAGYGIDLTIVLDLLMKAQIESALERRGINQETIAFVWQGVEGRLRERGVALKCDPTTIVAEALARGS